MAPNRKRSRGDDSSNDAVVRFRELDRGWMKNPAIIPQLVIPDESLTEPDFK